MKKSCCSLTIKISNAAENLIRKYGKDTYEAWLRREAEITKLSRGREYSRLVICWMREKNYRQMKEAGKLRDVA